MPDKFVCTECGACCRNGDFDLYIRAQGWNTPTGCKNYTLETKVCKIFKDRPWFCKTEFFNPEVLQALCDELHLKVFGVPREQEGVCNHREKVQPLNDSSPDSE